MSTIYVTENRDPLTFHKRTNPTTMSFWLLRVLDDYIHLEHVKETFPREIKLRPNSPFTHVLKHC